MSPDLFRIYDKCNMPPFFQKMAPSFLGITEATVDKLFFDKDLHVITYEKISES